MTPVTTIALIGAGNRGRGIFGSYALNMPHRASFVAVVEPDAAKRNEFGDQHNIPQDQRFADADAFFAAPKLAEAVIIATLENVRESAVLRSIDAGYHILCEKPLGSSPEEVIRICDAAANYDGVFIVCHQMRYNAGFDTLKRLITSGEYGEITAIQHSENLAYSHMAHSFVRGVFNNDDLTPMILAKCCHDMDILRYLIDSAPIRVSSFGTLGHFKEENAPEGAPDHCLDGCPAYETCPYHVLKLYFGDDADQAYIRQMGVVKDKHHLLELLKTNRFGRCVYKCDNNVVDRMVVNMEFENDVNVSFAMIGHNFHERRITKISLTNGELFFDVSEGIIKAHTYHPLAESVITPHGMAGSHNGGDRIIMDAFIDAITTGDPKFILTPVKMSLDSHLLAYAAEASRQAGQVVSLKDYEAQVRANM